jgi:hypothetical protein
VTRAAGALAALLVLNALLACVNVWPTLWVRPAAALSVEVALIVLAVAWLAARGRFSARALGALTAVVALMALGRYAEVTALALYGRPVNLYWDARHLPEVAAMLASAASRPELAFAAAAVSAALALLVLVVRTSLGALGRAMQQRGTRRALAGLAGVVAGLYVAAGALEPARRDALFAVPVARSLAAQADLLLAGLIGRDAVAADAPALAPAGLAGLGSADVYLVFLESYGAAAWTVAVHRERLAPAHGGLASAIAGTGRNVVSAYFTSPTFGGASWLAHASVLTARETRGPDAYNRLMNSRADTMAHAFARHGRRVVALMPGLRQAWPEGAFYGFDAIHGADALDYRGPAFGWWRIPDQYALARLEAVEVQAVPRAPLFVFFPTITSHAPFRPTPPYQPDWARLTTDAPYDASVQPAAQSRESDWRDLAPAYADSIGYTIRSLAGFLRRREGEDLVMIVLGDHQPPAGVAGENASWDVPVHVIASRPAVLDALVAAGFTRGLAPAGASIGPLHALGPRLLDAFSGRRDVHAFEAGVNVARAGIAGQFGQ